MNKLVLIESPFLTKSGYGYRSYDFIMSLIELYPNWDINLVPLAWGNTAPVTLDKKNKKHKLLLDRILTNNLNHKPDIHIQITIANECRPVGKYNILITAGIETDIVSPVWLQGANKMDLILVSSKHSKNSFINAKYDTYDNVTGKVIGNLSLTTTIDTLFEGVDNIKFHKTNTISENINKLLEPITSDFNFLFVGSWLQGELGEDRKDVGMLVYTFLDEFKVNKNNIKQPGLILKTQGATPSKIDEHRITMLINKIKEQIQLKYPDYILPKIHLLHGELSTKELNELYNHDKVKCYVSYSKGEGWNRTPLEFSATKKPIIISNYGGHLDYLNSRGSILLNGKLKHVHSSVVWKDIIEKDMKWFTVDYESAKLKLKDVFNNYKKYLDRTRMQKFDKFTKDKMKERIKEIMDKYIPTETFNDKIQFNL